MRYTKRDIVCFAVGVPLVALGNALYVKSGLGISVMSSMAYVLSGKLTFFSYGVWNYIMQGVVLLVMMAGLKRFSPSYLLSFAVSVANGYVMDFFGFCLRPFAADTLIAQLVFFLLAIPVLGCGIAAGIMTRLPIPPFDIIVREFVHFKHKSPKTVKLTVDLCCLGVSTVLSLILYGNLSGLGVATVVMAFVNGYNVAFWKKQWQKLSERVTWLREE